MIAKSTGSAPGQDQEGLRGVECKIEGDVKKLSGQDKSYFNGVFKKSKVMQKPMVSETINFYVKMGSVLPISPLFLAQVHYEMQTVSAFTAMARGALAFNNNSFRLISGENERKEKKNTRRQLEPKTIHSCLGLQQTLLSTNSLHLS